MKRREPHGPSIAPELLDVLRHAVGNDGTHHRPGWRNNYCAAVGDEDSECERLVSMGLMERGRLINEGTARYFHCTDAGKTIGVERLPGMRWWAVGLNDRGREFFGGWSDRFGKTIGANTRSQARMSYVGDLRESYDVSVRDALRMVRVRAA